MAKKRSGRATTRDDEWEAHRGKAQAGKMPRGVAFDPSYVAAAAAAPEPIVDRPRPAKTRYPIDMETFLRLKERAAEQARPLARAASTLVADASKKTPELAAPAAAGVAMAPVALAVEPAAAPTALTNFAGIAATGWLPPDCTMAAGPSHLLLSVNSSAAIYSKTGGSPLVQRTLNAWFANVISAAKIFDPKALYDQHAGRWVLLAVALPTDTAAKESWFLISVSKTADPTGPWLNYKLDATKDGATATDNWADYPSLGLDNQALYLTANMFKFGGNFQYAKVRVVPKGPLYSGTGTVTFVDFTKLKNADGSSSFTVQPCHTFGAPGTQYLVNSYFPGASTTQNRLTLWSLTGPPTAPTLSKRTVATDPYGLPPDADQKGGAPPLDSGDVRVLNAVFRGGSVWAALTTQHDWGDGVGASACHWFQVNATSGALVQQGIFGAKKLHYFYPAVMPDTNGNMTMVFCRCGTSEFASIRYSGRKSTDPLGSLQASALLKAGAAHYTGLDGSGRNRWGDYAGIASDPGDGRNVWFYSMYATTDDHWATWVGSSRF